MAVGSLAASNEVAVCLSFAERQLARLALSWLYHLASRNSNCTGELGSCVWLDKNEGFGPAHAGDHLRSSRYFFVYISAWGTGDFAFRLMNGSWLPLITF